MNLDHKGPSYRPFIGQLMETMLLVEVCLFSSKRILLSVHSFTFYLLSEWLLLYYLFLATIVFAVFRPVSEMERQSICVLTVCCPEVSQASIPPPLHHHSNDILGLWAEIVWFYLSFREFTFSRGLAVERIYIMLQHKSFKTTFWQMGIWLCRWVLNIWLSKYPQWWMKVISFWKSQVFCHNFWCSSNCDPNSYFFSSFLPYSLPPSFLPTYRGWAAATCFALSFFSLLYCWLSLLLAPSFLWTTTRPHPCPMAFPTSLPIRMKPMPWSLLREAMALVSTSSLTPTVLTTTVTFCAWRVCRHHCFTR